MFKKYLVNLLIAIDEFANALTFGSPDETISSRAGKAMQKGKTWGCVLCKFLNLFQKDHCQLAIDKADGSRAVIPD